MISGFPLLLGFLAFTNAASVSSIPNISKNSTRSNLTSIHLQAQLETSAVNVWAWYCTKARNWSLPVPELDDCLGLLDFFWIETWDDQHRKSKEFRAPGAKKTTAVQTQWTPRKYTFRKQFNIKPVSTI